MYALAMSVLSCFLVQFLQGMSEKIKKGIETAVLDLTKEKEQREQEEVRKEDKYLCIWGGGI